MNYLIRRKYCKKLRNPAALQISYAVFSKNASNDSFFVFTTSKNYSAAQIVQPESDVNRNALFAADEIKSQV